MLKQFLTDSIVYSASTLISRGMAILLVPVYTRYFQPEEYGALDLLTVMATLVNYVVALEISQGVARSYADAKTTTSKQMCVSSALWFAIISYGIFLFISLPFSSTIAIFLLDSSKWDKTVQAILFAIVANGMFFLLQDLLRWQLKPLRHAVASFIYTFVSSAVAISFVVSMTTGVRGIIYGQCVGAFVGIFVAWYNGAAKHWRFRFRWDKWLEMVSYSAPQVFSSIAAYFALYVDRLLIKKLMTLDDVGVYGIGARFGSIVLLVMTGFQSALVPLVFKNYLEPSMPAQLARVFSYFLVCAISSVLLLFTFSKELVWIFTTPEYYDAWTVIPIIATGVLLSSMYIFTLGIYIARRTILVVGINIVAAVFNIVANYLLIPKFGLIGAAFATLFSALLGFLLYLYSNQRYYPIPFFWKRIITATIIGITCAIILAGIQVGAFNSTIAFITKLIILIISLIAIVAVGLGRDEIQLVMNRIRKR